MMGDTRDEGDAIEKPVRKIKVENFYMGKYEVTQNQWDFVMKGKDAKNNDCGDCPAKNVSIYEAKEFIKRLNLLTNENYRLPTEEEWEYAAGDGSNKSRFGTGKDELNLLEANYNPFNKEEPELTDEEWNSLKVKKVGTYPPNKFGLCDMTGNVSEWCGNVYQKNGNSMVGTQKVSMDTYILRGGDFRSKMKDCRITKRMETTGFMGDLRYGIRLVYSK